MDLGATPMQGAKVIVPQIMPSIAFTMSFDDFIISYFVTGNGVNNISILVYTMSKRVKLSSTHCPPWSSPSSRLC